MSKLPRRNALRAGEYANRCRPEFAVQELIDAANAVKADMLMRAEAEDGGGKVVNMSNGCWQRFCQAIKRAEERA